MPYEGDKEKGVLFQISGRTFAICVLSLPSGAFVTCVILSIIYDLDASTRTHCGVKNYLPSISAVIGGFAPQKYIWRICIGLHCAPRFIIAIMHWNYYKCFKPRSYPVLYSWLVPVLGLLHLSENACLVTLSFISSTENYHIHENMFIGFMVFSEIYMILTVILFKWSRAGTPMNQADQKSYRLKMLFMLMNLMSFAVAIYFFFRHNAYCEPGIYTLFAFCEYLIIFSNIGFHGSAGLCDFGNGHWKMEAPIQRPKLI